MKLQLKKPSDLKKSTHVDSIHETMDGNGIAVYCPDCGLEQEYKNKWPINILIHCEDKECDCQFIIDNDTPIED